MDFRRGEALCRRHLPRIGIAGIRAVYSRRLVVAAGAVLQRVCRAAEKIRYGLIWLMSELTITALLRHAQAEVRRDFQLILVDSR
jgi:hypothetical protein